MLLHFRANPELCDYKNRSARSLVDAATWARVEDARRTLQQLPETRTTQRAGTPHSRRSMSPGVALARSREASLVIESSPESAPERVMLTRSASRSRGARASVGRGRPAAEHLIRGDLSAGRERVPIPVYSFNRDDAVPEFTVRGFVFVCCGFVQWADLVGGPVSRADRAVVHAPCARPNARDDVPLLLRR
jgi:hypothetical protein